MYFDLYLHANRSLFWGLHANYNLVQVSQEQLFGSLVGSDEELPNVFEGGRHDANKIKVKIKMIW